VLYEKKSDYQVKVGLPNADPTALVIYDMARKALNDIYG
jgi:hypothetical protein